MRHALALSCCLLSSAALGADAPLAITAAEPATAGRARVQVVAMDDTIAATLAEDGIEALRAEVSQGTAVPLEAVALAPPAQHTLLAFDRSGSFHTRWSTAFELAGVFRESADEQHEVSVVTFGLDLIEHGGGTTPEAVDEALAAARENGAMQGSSRLRAFIRETASLADKALPLADGGVRQVVLFTDAGEESAAWTVDEVIDWARGLGVRVHVVAWYRPIPSAARRLDEVQRIAEGTGGRFVQVTDPVKARATLRDVATAASRTWWVSLGFCGVPTDQGARFDDTIEIEVWDEARLGHSIPFPFRQHASGIAVEPCPEKEPEAAPVAAEPPKPSGGLVVPGVILGLLALGGAVGALVFALRQRTGSASAPKVATALALVDAPIPLPSRIPIRQQQIVVGASPECDVVIDVDQVSGEHATLRIADDGMVWVRDEGSTNGTWVDGHRATPGEPLEVHAGARIAFSRRVIFRLEQG